MFNKIKNIKIKICLIDDLYYGIPQVINSIPKTIEYEFYYYNRITDIENINFDIIILDFFLDKDNKTALDIISNFLWKIIIWFSSEDSKNDLIIKNGWIYKATKLKNYNINVKLKKVMHEIFKTRTKTIEKTD